MPQPWDFRLSVTRRPRTTPFATATVGSYLRTSRVVDSGRSPIGAALTSVLPILSQLRRTGRRSGDDARKKCGRNSPNHRFLKYIGSFICRTHPSFHLGLPRFGGLIDRMALERPDSVYLSSPESGIEWTYLELRRQSNRLGLKLMELGFSAGDKVAFMMDNGVFTAGVFLGTIYAGFVSVPLNVRAGRTQLAYMLDHSDAKVVFVSPEYEELLQQVQAELGSDLTVIRADVDHGPGWDQNEPRDVCLPEVLPDAPALLIYTSGSTEQPKGALHTQRTFVVGGWNTAIPHELSPADRTLCVLPLYHINAESISLLGTLLTGGTVIMPHRFIVREFWKWIADHRCTWTAIVPTIVSQLLDWVNPRAEGKEEALERIRFIRSSSAPLAPALHRAFEDKFGLLLIEAMGSTECGGNIFSNPLPPGKDKIGTPGRPYGFELRVLSPEGTEVCRGEPGEIHLRGPSIMAGYYKNPEGTSAVLDCDGWLRTGDLAYLDEDGYVFIIGRAKELIIKGGMNVAPRQIDDVLLSHAAVQEAAALGVPDHYFGEDIVAFVVLRPGAKADEQELREFCENQLGSFKSPTDIYFVADLPKGPTGKVQRLRLGECFSKILQVYPRTVVKDASDNVGVPDAAGQSAGRAALRGRGTDRRDLGRFAQVAERGCPSEFLRFGGPLVTRHRDHVPTP